MGDGALVGMVQRFTLPKAPGEAVAHPDSPRWWRSFAVWFPLAVYAVGRAVDAAMFEVMQRSQIALGTSVELARVLYPTPQAPGYFAVTANWDGQWYHEIADLGYPVPLPVGADGAVVQNPWAFYPTFPMLTRGVMRLTGWGFYVAGSTLSLVAGAVAIVLLFRLVDSAVGRWSAIVTVVATSSYLAAPVLQTNYTESCALLVVVVTLLLLRARRYLWVFVSLVVLALTRNIVLAMAPVMLAHFAIRWLRRDVDPFPWLHRWLVLGLAAAAGALTSLWPTICAIVTGDRQGYTETMAAWRVTASEIKLHTWVDYVYYDYGYLGWAVAGTAVALFTWFMLTHRTQRWGPELWAWAGAYPAYQVLVTGIGSSRIRYALLAFPFALLVAWFLNLARWRRWRVAGLVAVALVGTVLQGWWIWNYWVITSLTPDVQFP
jgi:hypothetical protein